MIPILAALASEGLGLLTNAIMAKGKEVIEDKIGVKIPDKKEDLTPELIAQLKIKEMEHEEILLSFAIKQAEVSLEVQKEENKNTQGARDMNLGIQTSSTASKLAKEAAYYLDFIIVGGAVLVTLLVLFVKLEGINQNMAFSAAGSLWTLAGTVVNFHRGTSSSSEKHGAAIHEALKGIK